MVMIILRFPHLVLTDVSDHDGVASGGLPQIVDDVCGIQMAAIRKRLNVDDRGIALEFANVRNPFGMVAILDEREKTAQGFTGIADDGGINLHVLVDFGAVDFNVNLEGIAGVSAQITGNAVIEAHAHGNEQIGFLNRVVDPGFAVHAHHSEIERILGGETADAQKCHRYGNSAGVHEILKNLHGVGKYDAAAGEDERAFGGIQKFHGTIEFSRIVIFADALGRQFGRGSVPVKFRGGLLCVFGDVDENRSGAPGLGDDEGFAYGAGDVFGFGDDHIVLSDRHGDAGDIHFLKGVGAEKLAANLSGDADHGRRIEHCGGDASDHIGGAGAGSSHGHAHAAAGARVAVSHVGCALFVADENVMQLGFSERVIDRKNRATGITENVLHAKARERFAEDFRTSQLHRVLPDDTGVAPEEKLVGTVVTAPSEAEETRYAYLAMTPWV